MFSVLGGHAGKQQVSSVQEGEFGVKYLVLPKQDGQKALTYKLMAQIHCQISQNCNRNYNVTF